ncbi:sulfite exporter TauE/SafE family protein [Anaeroselena agilis]|uniref:Probable membrane transporter protein n=1 Tax=Anaeroselena agilis TaxID=3063788 RepID=A0ABU3NX35_9FIRM|nr:sulfite exporter TauE/SafE family protein [Selenomonadales bacterium 4137-cl]
MNAFAAFLLSFAFSLRPGAAEYTTREPSRMNQSLKLVGVGFAVGSLSGLLGIGGGVFMVPIMVTYFAFSQHIAQATSLAVVVPTGMVGALVYGLHGNLDLGITLNIVVGSMLGASVGARLAKKLPAAQLKKLFGIMLILAGVRMVLS